MYFMIEKNLKNKINLTIKIYLINKINYLIELYDQNDFDNLN